MEEEFKMKSQKDLEEKLTQMIIWINETNEIC
jgi:hypothetical protein